MVVSEHCVAQAGSPDLNKKAERAVVWMYALLLPVVSVCTWVCCHNALA
jgi:hypothetical protein